MQQFDSRKERSEGEREASTLRTFFVDYINEWVGRRNYLIERGIEDLSVWLREVPINTYRERLSDHPESLKIYEAMREKGYADRMTKIDESAAAINSMAVDGRLTKEFFLSTYDAVRTLIYSRPQNYQI